MVRVQWLVVRKYTRTIMAANGFRSLIVWQKAMELAVFVYKLTETFPRAELYGLVSQLRRAVSSIAANVAEGYGRTHRGEKLQFLGIANGSLSEVETFSELACRLGFITHDDLEKIVNASQEIGRLLGGLKRRISSQPLTTNHYVVPRSDWHGDPR